MRSGHRGTVPGSAVVLVHRPQRRLPRLAVFAMPGFSALGMLVLAGRPTAVLAASLPTQACLVVATGLIVVALPYPAQP